jgi:hypothetical protein
MNLAPFRRAVSAIPQRMYPQRHEQEWRDHVRDYQR